MSATPASAHPSANGSLAVGQRVASIATGNVYTVLRRSTTYSTHGREFYWVQRDADGWCPSGPKQLGVDFRALPQEVEVRAEVVDMGGDVTEEVSTTDEDEEVADEADGDAPPARKTTKPKAKPKAKPKVTKVTKVTKPKVRKLRVPLQLPHQAHYDPEADPDAEELVERLQRALVQRAAAAKRAPLKDGGAAQADQYAGWLVGLLAARAPDAPFHSLRTLHAWASAARHLRAALAAATGLNTGELRHAKWLDNHVSALNALTCDFFAFAEADAPAEAEAEAEDEAEAEAGAEAEADADEEAGAEAAEPQGPAPAAPSVGPEGSPTKKKKKKKKKNKRKRGAEGVASPETPPPPQQEKKKKKKKKKKSAAAVVPLVPVEGF